MVCKGVSVNAEELYELIKHAMGALDVEWDEKHLIKVEFEDRQIVFSYGDLRFTKTLAKESL